MKEFYTVKEGIRAKLFTKTGNHAFPPFSLFAIQKILQV